MEQPRQHKYHFGCSGPGYATATCVCGLQFSAEGPKAYQVAGQKLSAHVSSTRQHGIETWDNEGGPCPGEHTR